MMDTGDFRPSGKHLTDIEIAKILGCNKGGATQREIAGYIGCSQKAVQHMLTTYNFDMFQGRNKRRDYKHKTTIREDRYIKRTLKQNSSLPLRDITNVVGQKVIPISRWTLARRRSEAGLGSYIAAEKPGLCDVNVALCLEWALKHRDWTIEQWKRVIWSDESTIWVGVNPCRQWVIHPPRERLNRKYVRKTFKSAQVKVMVWACFTGERLGSLLICDEGRIGADEYEDILYDGLFSLVDDLLEPPEEPEMIQVADENTFIFMQDNAPYHKANSILEFLEENHVPIMQWSPQSSNLNPIENLWTELKALFHRRFLELFNHLSKSLEARYRYGEVLQELWYSQGMELVNRLIESMPR